MKIKSSDQQVIIFISYYLHKHRFSIRWISFSLTQEDKIIRGETKMGLSGNCLSYLVSVFKQIPFAMEGKFLSNGQLHQHFQSENAIESTFNTEILFKIALLLFLTIKWLFRQIFHKKAFLLYVIYFEFLLRVLYKCKKRSYQSH